ncbi:MAG: hypothetical protein EHM47_12200 [Ignavibacteriales bacterium]|nr:MAG: hypothetical protein EHM47_12200 [Ignavibacteriales bacterium]
MKMFSQFFTIILISFLFLGGKSFAQNNEQPLLIVSFNQVSMSNMGTVSRLADSLFVPILKELVDEGMIYSFGQFNHSWGDEWNYNMWYTAKDMASFDKFWDEYVKRGSERHPGSFAAITKYFNAHKDNIYTIRNQYPIPPAR